MKHLNLASYNCILQIYIYIQIDASLYLQELVLIVCDNFSTDGTTVGKLMVMNNYSPSISFFVCVSSVGMMFPETVLVY